MLEKLQFDEGLNAASSEAQSRLSVQLRHRIGALNIEVEFQITQPWTILFGASGSGKTTILRAIAGLLRPDFGRIVYSHAGREKSVTFADTVAGIFVAPHRRRIPLAAQKPNLFPHSTVEENLRYGIEAPSESGLQIERETLKVFGLAAVAKNLPDHISGGEAQRVNLARALAATASRLLLLDEPFTGMDIARRDMLLPALRDRLAREGTPVLSVTHDVAEAFQLGAEVIQIAEGKIVQQGPVAVVLANERARLLEQLSGAGRSRV